MERLEDFPRFTASNRWRLFKYLSCRIEKTENVSLSSEPNFKKVFDHLVIILCSIPWRFHRHHPSFCTSSEDANGGQVLK